MSTLVIFFITFMFHLLSFCCIIIYGVILMSIGEKIKIQRLKKGMTQEDLANKSNLSRVAIGNYERGDRSPNMDILTKIADALKVQLNELIENKISSVEDLFDIFDIDKTFLELSQISGLHTNTIGKIFSPYKKGYTEDDVRMLARSLNLNDNQIQDWILFNNEKPYENKKETEIFYWYHCIANYPYETVEGVDITEFKLKYIKEIVKEIDSTFRKKVKEISERDPSNN